MSAFNTVLQVRFGHVDPAGIAYFPRIYDYLHDVFESLWEEHVGQRYYHLLLERKIGFPLVHSEVEFKNPLHFGDRPVVSVTCTKLGSSSMTLRYRFSLGDKHILEARMTTVCTKLEGMEPIPIPDDFSKSFEEILEVDEE